MLYTTCCVAVLGAGSVCSILYNESLLNSVRGVEEHLIYQQLPVRLISIFNLFILQHKSFMNYIDNANKMQKENINK